MKIFPIRLILFFPVVVFAQNQSLKLDASLGLGYADYTEVGSIRPVKSDWSGATSTFTLGARAVGMSLVPYFRLGLMGSEGSTETWKQNGQLIQKNDMFFAGIDLMSGLEWPLQAARGTVTPSVGLLARYQSFIREDFVLYEPGGAGFARASGSVEEVVESYGVGSGLLFEFPLGETWEMELGTQAYWLFYTYAENDAFESEIEGEDGWIWQASLSLGKKLIKSGQVMGLRIQLDFQQITGAVSHSGESFVEWPDNDWQNISAELFWRGEF